MSQDELRNAIREIGGVPVLGDAFHDGAADNHGVGDLRDLA